MVLLCILENFVHGSSTAWSIDDTTKWQGENMVLTDTVLKEFGYMRGEGCGRLVTVKPSGYAKTFITSKAVESQVVSRNDGDADRV